MKRISGILTGLSFLLLGVACGNAENAASMDYANSTNSTFTNCMNTMPEKTIYVAADSKAASPDGTTWSKAFKDLQSAIDAGAKQLEAKEVARVTIAVKQGTYQPTGTTNVVRDGYVNSLASFGKLTQADIWGGFKGKSLCKEDQDKNLFETTILSGVIDGSNVKKPNQKNAFHVLNFFYPVYPKKSDVDVKLVGFKVTGGMGDEGVDKLGGGAALYGALDKGITFDSLTFDNNKSTGPGGAIYSDDSNLNIVNSKFTNNTALSGAAIRLWSGTATIATSTFTGNKATDGGAAVEVSGTLTLNGYTKDKLAPSFSNNVSKDIATSGSGTVKYNP